MRLWNGRKGLILHEGPQRNRWPQNKRDSNGFWQASKSSVQPGEPWSILSTKLSALGHFVNNHLILTKIKRHLLPYNEKQTITMKQNVVEALKWGVGRETSVLPVAEEECEWRGAGAQQTPPGLAAQSDGQQQQLSSEGHEAGQHRRHQPQRRLAQLQTWRQTPRVSMKLVDWAKWRQWNTSYPIAVDWPARNDKDWLFTVLLFI